MKNKVKHKKKLKTFGTTRNSENKNNTVTVVYGKEQQVTIKNRMYLLIESCICQINNQLNN